MMKAFYITIEFDGHTGYLDYNQGRMTVRSLKGRADHRVLALTEQFDCTPAQAAVFTKLALEEGPEMAIAVLIETGEIEL